MQKFNWLGCKVTVLLAKTFLLVMEFCGKGVWGHQYKELVPQLFEACHYFPQIAVIKKKHLAMLSVSVILS